MINKISFVLLTVIAAICILVWSSSDEEPSLKENSSMIGRRGDTISVYAIEPTHCKVKELVKINGSWYLYGDTSCVVDNVEIIQRNKVSVEKLTFTFNDSTYVYSCQYQYNN